MTKIMHTDMRRGKEVPAEQPKTYVVEDLSGIDDKLAAFEDKPISAEPAVKSSVGPSFIPPAPKTVGDEPKRVLEKLIFMGKHSKVVEIADHKFEISTLTNKENNDIVRRVINMGQAADLFTIRILTLAHALKTVDGIRPEDMPLDGEFESEFHKKITILDNMQSGLVERIFNAYEEIIKESNEVVYHEQIKN